MTTALRRITWRQAWVLGLVSTCALALSSHCVGAVRARGGLMQSLGLTALTFGHMAGVLTLVMWASVVGLIVSWAVAGGHILRHGHRLSPAMLAAWTLPFLLAGPLMSRDVYSYLAQGAMVRDGYDPYVQGAAANPGPMLFEVSADWRNTTTPYGPLHLWIGEGITTLTGDNITLGIVVYRLVTMASYACAVWAIARLAQHFGTRADVAVWLGLANPLSLIHLLGGMHNEVTMVALIAAALLAAVRLSPVRGLVLAAALVGVGTALKATAVIAAPFLVWITVSRIAGPAPRSLWKERARRIGTLAWTGPLAALIVGAVLLAITVCSGQTWGWIVALAGNTKVINPLSLPSAIASTLTPVLGHIDDSITFNVILGAVRPVTSLLMVLGLAIAWWVCRREARTALIGASVGYLLISLLNAVVLPWYYTPLIALVAVWARRRSLIFVTAWACSTLALMFDGGGNNRLYVLWWVLLVAGLSWTMLRACFGYRPGMATEHTDMWEVDLTAPQRNPAGATRSPSPAPAA